MKESEQQWVDARMEEGFDNALGEATRLRGKVRELEDELCKAMSELDCTRVQLGEMTVELQKYKTDLVPSEGLGNHCGVPECLGCRHLK